MKAIVHHAYGAPLEVLELGDVPEPTAGDGEVLVRVHAASVNPADWHFIRGLPYLVRIQAGPRRPKHTVTGCDLAGRVEAVGAGVTAFEPGDEVFGSAFAGGFGAFAELASVPAELLARKPARVSFAQAAAAPIAALTALEGLRDHGAVGKGHRVLIVGASGGVGTFAVQVGKMLDAEVTGVCSTRNVERVRSLGADHVIDYTRTDFSEGLERYDAILQLAGTLSPRRCRRVLTEKGTLVQSSGEGSGRVLGPIARVLAASALSPFVSQKLTSFTVKPTGRSLQQVADLIETGTLTPVIDRTYPLAEGPQAVAYVDEGHAQGKVVIEVTGGS